MFINSRRIQKNKKCDDLCIDDTQKSSEDVAAGIFEVGAETRNSFEEVLPKVFRND